MSVGRTVGWVVAVVIYVGLIVATAGFLSLDTLAQANWIYTATALVLLTAVAGVAFAVRVYHHLDELSQRIHLMALAVAFVGTFVLAAAWALVALVGLVDDSGFLRLLLSPGPRSSASYYLLGLMVGLYLIGWLWGRSRYR